MSDTGSSPKRASREAKVTFALSDDHIKAAQVIDDLKWQDFLRGETSRLLTAFYWLNGGVFLLVFSLWIGQLFHPATSSFPPIVTERVLLALIAASAAQLGALAFAAAIAVFRRGNNSGR